MKKILKRKKTLITLGTCIAILGLTFGIVSIAQNYYKSSGSSEKEKAVYQMAEKEKERLKDRGTYNPKGHIKKEVVTVNEVGYNWKQDALDACALAIKNYGVARKYTKKYPEFGYDIKDDEYDQVYDPKKTAMDKCKRFLIYGIFLSMTQRTDFFQVFMFIV